MEPAESVYKVELVDTDLVTCSDISHMCVTGHGTRDRSLDTRLDTLCGHAGHVCVRSLYSWTASDNNLSFCLCDWTTRDTIVPDYFYSLVTLPIRM